MISSATFKRRWPWIILILMTVFVGWSFYLSFYRIYNIPTNPEQLTLYSLYSIDGGDYDNETKPVTTEEFDGCPVLGKVAVTDRHLKQTIMAALRQGIAEDKGLRPKCFYPRHGIRIVFGSRTIDYLICYQCYSIVITEGSQKAGRGTSDVSKSLLNKTLQDAGVTLPPVKKTE